MMMIRPITILLIVTLTGVADAAPPAIVVSDAWSRPAEVTAVVYASLRNRAPLSDRLIGAESPSATNVTLHETKTMKTSPAAAAMDNMPMNGALTSMKSLSAIPIPARGSTLLKPGGYHLMLDLRRGLKAGQTIPLRLHFARAGWIATTASVRATP